MDNLSTDFQDNDADTLSYRVSDEALEIAAASVTNGAGSLTISFCTGLDTCPA